MGGWHGEQEAESWGAQAGGGHERAHRCGRAAINQWLETCSPRWAVGCHGAAAPSVRERLGDARPHRRAICEHEIERAFGNAGTAAKAFREGGYRMTMRRLAFRAAGLGGRTVAWSRDVGSAHARAGGGLWMTAYRTIPWSGDRRVDGALTPQPGPAAAGRRGAVHAITVLAADGGLLRRCALVTFDDCAKPDCSVVLAAAINAGGPKVDARTLLSCVRGEHEVSASQAIIRRWCLRGRAWRRWRNPSSPQR